MKNLILYLLMTSSSATLFAQKIVEERVPVSGQSTLKMDFPFVNKVLISTWDKQEVYAEATVMVNGNRDNDVFELSSRGTNSRQIVMEMDKELWDEKTKQSRSNSWTTDIVVEVFIPKTLELEAETISGTYELTYYGKPFFFKTISGDVDLSIASNEHIDFMVKTVSGEIYSDLDLSYPNGKDGLKKVVGMDLEGRLNNGGKLVEMETISGNIFLRSL